MEAAQRDRKLAALATTFSPAVPQMFIKSTATRLEAGLSLDDCTRHSCFMGGAFINYFNRFGRQWQVYVQAEAITDGYAESFPVHIKTKTGSMVSPLSGYHVERHVGA